MNRTGRAQATGRRTAPEPEDRDAADGVAGLIFAGLDRRSKRDNRGHAANARARRNQRAEFGRNPHEPAQERRDQQGRADAGRRHGQRRAGDAAGRPESELESEQDDAGPQSRRDHEADPRPAHGWQPAKVPEDEPEQDGHGDAAHEIPAVRRGRVKPRQAGDAETQPLCQPPSQPPQARQPARSLEAISPMRAPRSRSPAFDARDPTWGRTKKPEGPTDANQKQEARRAN